MAEKIMDCGVPFVLSFSASGSVNIPSSPAEKICPVFFICTVTPSTAAFVRASVKVKTVGICAATNAGRKVMTNNRGFMVEKYNECHVKWILSKRTGFTG
jgi:hypothetical protein